MRHYDNSDWASGARTPDHATERRCFRGTNQLTGRVKMPEPRLLLIQRRSYAITQTRAKTVTVWKPSTSARNDNLCRMKCTKGNDASGRITKQLLAGRYSPAGSRGAYTGTVRLENARLLPDPPFRRGASCHPWSALPPSHRRPSLRCTRRSFKKLPGDRDWRIEPFC